jgi:hypothetical protein
MAGRLLYSDSVAALEPFCHDTSGKRFGIMQWEVSPKLVNPWRWSLAAISGANAGAEDIEDALSLEKMCSLENEFKIELKCSPVISRKASSVHVIVAHRRRPRLAGMDHWSPRKRWIGVKRGYARAFNRLCFPFHLRDQNPVGNDLKAIILPSFMSCYSYRLLGPQSSVSLCSEGTISSISGMILGFNEEGNSSIMYFLNSTRWLWCCELTRSQSVCW